jgi:hypothetical protein
MWKLVEAEDGTLTGDDLLVLSVLLADTIRRAERRAAGQPVREREIWEKLQPALRVAQGWAPREGDGARDSDGTHAGDTTRA